MKTTKMYRYFEQLDTMLKRKVALKYIRNPEKAIFRAPSDQGEFVDVIEIWDNDEYHFIIVTPENLQKIDWNVNLDNNEEDIGPPYFDKDDFGEFYDWSSMHNF